MDVVPPKHPDPAIGDDELAKVLAGVSDDPNEQITIPNGVPGLQFEEIPAPNGSTPTVPAQSVESTLPSPSINMEVPQVNQQVSPTPTASAGSVSSLEDLKRTALGELRPLVDKLTLTPEEKFDTLLLIIRSTDDQSLLVPAHEAARGIADETKRAQALLDVIKEIDYFGSSQ